MDARTPVFHWSTQLESGNGNVDRQHQYVLILANTVIDEAQIDGESPQLRPAFEALTNYVADHFRDEEAFLGSIESDQLASQQREHEAMLRNLNSVWPSAEDSCPADIEKRVRGWIEGELVPHIQDADIKAVQLARYSSVQMETGESGRVERFEMTYDQN